MVDRHGKWRHYLRRPGFKRIALAGLYGSEEFAASYRLAMAGSAAPPREIGADRTPVGSLAHLIGVYKGSTHWAGLARNSRRNRQPLLERLRCGVWGGVMVADLARKHIVAILDSVAAPHAKKHLLKSLRGLLAFGIEIDLIETDPSVGIKIKVVASDGYHSWTDAEISQYRDYWPLGTQQRLALELGLETASRRCEITRLGRQHVRDGRIRVERVKGTNDVDLPVTTALAVAIDAMPATGGLTYLVTPAGKPYSPDALGSKFAEWATAAGLPPRCRLHGLRKSRAAQLATAGASAHEIAAITGHRSLAEVQRYADKYNRAKAADAATARLLKTGTEL
jgi:integrase